MASATGYTPPMLLIHPIGVGLSSRFWDRFIQSWHHDDPDAELIAPDLFGCGQADCSSEPLTPSDWARPLIRLLSERNSRPVLLVTQGSSLPIALALLERAPELVCGLVAISPPGWRVLSEATSITKARRLWRWLFKGPIGNLFYRYARRRAFLRSFSEKNLFSQAEAVDEEWLQTLKEGSRDMNTRWAVYSFLAGFWRRDWQPQLSALTLPFLVVFGSSATGIGRSRSWDDFHERLETYRRKLPQAIIETIPGRNVLPYESTEACVGSISSWMSAHINDLNPEED
ncbi:alpha/beta fold hydrolase [Synechococcus sp. MIT S9507]|uniref:alpha/beta fold hydrolase n=1 Tax=Synechococcus sp. MIT S9507 TaxID=3082544 RepID=UPI0039B6C2E1